MKALYNEILTRLQSEVTEIAEIDFETGQLETIFGETPTRPSVELPCALVDIDYPQCSDEEEAGTIQTIRAKVSIKLAFEVQKPTDSLASEVNRSAGLAFLDVVQKVYEAFQGYSTDVFEAFSRRSQSPDKRFDGSGLKVYDIVFETSFLDILEE